MEKSNNIVWGSEAIRLEVEALQAEQEALRQRFADRMKYCREMDRLNDLLRKYKHRWVVEVNGVQQEPSQRLLGWVDRYNTLARTPLFGWWCDLRGKPIHDAYDVLA
jgi:hypothetical protein